MKSDEKSENLQRENGKVSLMENNFRVYNRRSVQFELKSDSFAVRRGNIALACKVKP